MKPVMAVGLAVVGGLIIFRSLPQEARRRLTAGMKRRVLQRMEQMMASLPEGAPPKLIMSVLPALQAQNDHIITLLQELKELLRAQQRTAQ